MESLTHALTVIQDAHPYVQILAIMGVALFSALVVLPFVSGFIRHLTRKTETDVDDQLIGALNSPIFYFALLVGASASLPLLALSEGVHSVGTSILKTLFVLVIGQALFRVVRIMLDGASRAERLKAINTQTLPLFNNISFIVIGAGVLYAFFVVWGIDVTAWLASAGIIGIAVGFAAKDTLSNIISGIFILADRPYAVGDYVELGSGTTGIVTDIKIRSTRISTFNDEEVTIPNAVIANEEIINKTAGPERGRVNVNIGVSYGSDVPKVEQILLDIARNHEKVLAEPEPVVRFEAFGESSLDFSLICRVPSPLDVFPTRSDMHHSINIAFNEAGIEIPFPQRDVYIKNQ